jgi:hypothetical protein
VDCESDALPEGEPDAALEREAADDGLARLETVTLVVTHSDGDVETLAVPVVERQSDGEGEMLAVPVVERQSDADGDALAAPEPEALTAPVALAERQSEPDAVVEGDVDDEGDDVAPHEGTTAVTRLVKSSAEGMAHAVSESVFVA